MSVLHYDKIVKYKIVTKCDAPLHIGAAMGGREEVLLNPVSQIPFVQASSIAGVFRNFYEKKHDKEKTKHLFGTSNSSLEEISVSRIRFQDGIFDAKSFKLETRPHVKINRQTGTVASADGSGQKYNVVYVGTGSRFSWDAYLFIDSKEGKNEQEEFEELLSAMKEGFLFLGSKKSSGAGKNTISSVSRRIFDMTKEKDRQLWNEEENLKPEDYEEIVKKLPETGYSNYAYQFRIMAKTEGALQVKGIALSDFGKGVPDSQNLKNAEGKYIVPGSSIRGTIRSQMERILSYLCSGKTGQTLIEEAFGKGGEKGKDGCEGYLGFEDSVVGQESENEKAPLRHRIHIDKFTGGIFHGGLFNEKNVFGDLEIGIHILDKKKADAIAGLVCLAIRDLAIGAVSLGNGYANGKGFLNVSEIVIIKGDRRAQISLKDGQTISDKDKIIRKAMDALKAEVVS